MNDHLSDFATRLRNAYRIGKSQVVMPHTKLIESVAKVLVANNYLAAANSQKEGSHKSLTCELLYADRKPAISHIKRISKPGIRIYHKHTEFRPVLSGLGLAVISTSKGVMTANDARKQKLGGEVLLELW